MGWWHLNLASSAFFHTLFCPDLFAPALPTITPGHRAPGSEPAEHQQPEQGLLLKQRQARASSNPSEHRAPSGDELGGSTVPWQWPSTMVRPSINSGAREDTGYQVGCCLPVLVLGMHVVCIRLHGPGTASSNTLGQFAHLSEHRHSQVLTAVPCGPIPALIHVS